MRTSISTFWYSANSGEPAGAKRPADVHLLAEEAFAAGELQRALQIARVDERAEARVDGADVVVLEVDLEERLPIEVVLLLVDAFQHDVAAGKLGPAVERSELVANVARAGEEQAIPIGQLGSSGRDRDSRP